MYFFVQKHEFVIENSCRMAKTDEEVECYSGLPYFWKFSCKKYFV